MGCNIPFNTIDHAFGLATWLYFGLTFYVFGMFLTWRREFYKTIQSLTFWCVSERVYFVLTLVLTELNAYAAWRLWVCENWDVYFAPLLMGMLMMLFMNIYPLLVMVTRYSSAYLLCSIAYTVFAIVFTIFGFLKDTTAGIIGIFDIILGILYFGFALYAWSEEHKIHYKHHKRTEKRATATFNASLTVPDLISDANTMLAPFRAN